MKIVCDIGGTYARFGTVAQGTLHYIQKYNAGDYDSFAAALTHYCTEQGLDDKGSLAIATAAYEDGQTWRFVNQNKWIIDPAALAHAGWHVELVLNDFAASVWGLLALTKGDKTILKPGIASDLPQCLIGPGTGLGLGYLIPLGNGHYHVQRTHGGHMLATAHTDEQALILKTVKRLEPSQDGEQATVFEHLVSGTGLYNIYSALCLIGGSTPITDNVETLLSYKDNVVVQEALRLFHEFFGLYARAVTITAHAYGGLYLTGGVLEKLSDQAVFDFRQFEKYFLVPGVESVTTALQNTPIIHMNEPYLGLKGMMQASASGQGGG